MSTHAVNAAHSFRPLCLVERGLPAGVAEAIAEAVSYGRCPRCLTRLPDEPCGTVTLSCHCIPLCDVCVSDEADAELITEPGDWPIPVETRIHRAAQRKDAEDLFSRLADDAEHEEDHRVEAWGLQSPVRSGKAPEPVPERPYTAADSALDALAMMEAIRQQDPAALEGLWATIEPPNRCRVAAVLGSWVITMNDLTALDFGEWAKNIREAALAMKDAGE